MRLSNLTSGSSRTSASDGTSSTTSRGGGYAGSTPRAEDFRRAHHVGDRLAGKLLSWETRNTAWVELDGRPMLARVDTLPPPEPGQTLHFEVTALHPEVLLRELILTGGGLPEDPSSLFREFVAARGQFEALARETLRELAQESKIETPKERRERRRKFLRKLAKNKDALKSYLRLLGLSQRISSMLGYGDGEDRQRGSYRYAPWLLPEATEQELLIECDEAGPESAPESPDTPDSRFWRIVYAFHLLGLGRGQLRLFYRAPRAGYRVLLERPEHAPRLLAMLGKWDFGLPELNLDCLGVSPLPPDECNGLLAGKIAVTRGGGALRSALNVRI